MTTQNNQQTTQPQQHQQQRKHQRLADQYPVNTLWEMTLEDKEKVSGRIYCTDDFSKSVVLQKPLVHTTLASDVRIVHAPSIVSANRLPEEEQPQQQQQQSSSAVAWSQSPASSENSTPASNATPLSKPLPKIQKKTLDERERKALRQAEESFKHINQKVRRLLASYPPPLASLSFSTDPI